MTMWFRYTLPRLIREFFGWVRRGFKPEPPTTFHNIKEFCEHMWAWPDEGEPVDLKRIEECASHRVYEYTSCGAWLRFVREIDPDREIRQFAVKLSEDPPPLGILEVCEVEMGWMRDAPMPPEKWPRELKWYLCLEPMPGCEDGFVPLGKQKIADLFTPATPDEKEPQYGEGHLWRPEKGNPKKGILEVFVKVPKLLKDPAPEFGIWGIEVGSIVEGTDAEVQPETLLFPFTEEEYDRMVQNVEQGAQEIWNNTHGCAHCWTEGTTCPEEGDCPRCDDPSGTPGDGSVDPNCKSCDGDGVVI